MYWVLAGLFSGTLITCGDDVIATTCTPPEPFKLYRHVAGVTLLGHVIVIATLVDVIVLKFSVGAVRAVASVVHVAGTGATIGVGVPTN
jgi:hypothetical protein